MLTSNSRSFHDEIRSNKIKSLVLVTFFILLAGSLGSVVGVLMGNLIFGLLFTLIFSLIYTLIAYYSGGSIVLSLSGARPVTKKEFPHLYHAIDGLSVAAGIPSPKAYVIEDSALNAFATGRDPQNSYVVVTTGLLKVMNRQELEGVIAHEMSHIKNYDIRFMMLTTVLIGIVTLLSDVILRSFLWHRKDDSKSNAAMAFILLGLVLAVLAPIIGQIIQLAISRKREFLADSTGAMMTRYPPGLASALKKIAKDPDPLVDTANRATAHLYISTPFRKTRGAVVNLFSTHPAIEERIKRLEEM